MPQGRAKRQLVTKTSSSPLKRRRSASQSSNPSDPHRDSHTRLSRQDSAMASQRNRPKTRSATTAAAGASRTSPLGQTAETLQTGEATSPDQLSHMMEEERSQAPLSIELAASPAMDAQRDHSPSLETRPTRPMLCDPADLLTVAEWDESVPSDGEPVMDNDHHAHGRSEHDQVISHHDTDESDNSGSNNEDHDVYDSHSGSEHSSTHNENDDDDNDEHPSSDPFTFDFFGQGFNPMDASSRLLAGLGFSTGNQQFKTLLTSLKEQKDPTSLLVTLQELAEALSIATEESLAGHFNVDAFAKELVAILKGPSGTGADALAASQPQASEYELMLAAMYGGAGNEFGATGSNPNVMLLACRCIDNMIEALPAALPVVVTHDAIPVLCAKLKDIEYVDLAEQALGTLEKISAEFPAAVVKEGGLAAALTYLDFFSIHVQRSAVTTAANCAVRIPPECFDRVAEVIPTLERLLGYSDQRLVEQTCLCLYRACRNFRTDSAKLQTLVTPAILSQVLAILAASVPGARTTGGEGASAMSISSAVFSKLVLMLTDVVRNSADLAERLLELDVVKTICTIFSQESVSELGTANEATGESMESATPSSAPPPVLIDLPTEQLCDLVSLLADLLPPLLTRLPTATESSPNVSRPLLSSRLFTAFTALQSAYDERAAIFAHHPVYVAQFGQYCLPVLLPLFSKTVNAELRRRVALLLVKVLHVMDSQAMTQWAVSCPLATFAVNSLNQQSTPLHVLITALIVVALLTRKLPSHYARQFRREGLVDRIDQWTTDAMFAPPQSRPSAATDAAMVDNDDKDLAVTTATAFRMLEQSLYPEFGQCTAGSLIALVNQPSSTASTDADPGSPTTHVTAATMGMLPESADITEDAKMARANVIHDWLAHQVTTLQSTFAQHLADQSPVMDQANMLVVLRQLGLALQGLQHSLAKCGRYGAAVQQLAAVFCRPDGVTAYELRESGVLDTMLTFLSATNHPSGLSLSARSQMFLFAFLVPTPGSDPAFPALAHLVRCLQDVLSHMEDLHLEAAPTTVVDSARNPMAMLAKQVRLLLLADDQPLATDVIGSRHIVSVHALASFQTLEDYLRPRLMHSAALSRGLTESDDNNRSHRSFMAETLRSLSMAASALSGVSGQLQAPNAMADDGSEILPDHTDMTSVAIPPPDAAGAVASPNADDTSDEESAEIPPPESQAATPVKGGPRSPVQSTPQLANYALTRSDSALRALARNDATPTTASSSQRPDSLPRPTSPDWHLQFELNGVPISDNEATIYSAIHPLLHADQSTEPRHPWSMVYTVKFSTKPRPAMGSSSAASPQLQAMDTADDRTEVPDGLIGCDTLLTLLAVLFDLNVHCRQVMASGPSASASSPLVPLSASQFVNAKFTAKLTRQLDEPLVVASQCLPPWCDYLVQRFAFLFPFEVRHSYLQFTSFGFSRSIARWQALHVRDNGSSGRRTTPLHALGRIQRQKVRISRRKMLLSAVKVLALYGSSHSALEIEYFDEVGTGLGPTLEFYATVSKELCRRDLHLWRDEDAPTDTTGTLGSSAYVALGPMGLFPRPYSPATVTTPPASVEAPTSELSGLDILKWFELMGQFVAKALLDSRILDLPLHPLFIEHILGHTVLPTLLTLRAVDDALAQSLAQLQWFVDQKQRIYSDLSLDDAAKLAQLRAVRTASGATVEDLGLDFTLPGYPDYQLWVGGGSGSDVDVTIFNVDQYVQRVLEATLVQGVEAQADHFRTGFSQVFPISRLQCFTANELHALIGSAEEDWSLTTLQGQVVADHGYTLSSPVVQYLLEVMSELTSVERRQFLRFITGSPKLPIGGFKQLLPSLTVVCKPCEAPLTADDYLPSVMTCVNYLKLPNYSSKAILKGRLYTAMKEGQSSFHLS
ncbi:Ubiquitin fusion degradation protein 4 [Dimargaris verticillata]|uniref:HECT-type E3 ubiquitin transferase n=1 Tax=Dimargaris verticillata TaxID=2761393 RepID=A0A9W8B6F7_9FUNG|nr:Ubiquitin fusion degradation protein 4 [Dimargaris verticillata]